MARCPNCGQKTTGSGDYCQYCHYPVLAGSRARQRRAQLLARKQAEEAQKRAKVEAEREAKEKAKRDVEEAKKAQEAEKLAEAEAEREAKEKAKRDASEDYIAMLLSRGKLNNITENLDRIMAIVGASGSLIVTVGIIIRQQSIGYRYIEAPILVLIVSLVYLFVTRSRYRSRISSPPELSTKLSAYLILNILFFGFLFLSILSVLLRPDPYSRPITYFVSMAIMTAVLAVEIIILPKGKAFHGFVLLKIALIALSLRYTIQLIFPDIVGIDPWWFRVFTGGIVTSGRIPEGTVYSTLPIMPLIIGSTMLITNLGYKLSAMLSISSLQVVSLVFVFLLGRFIHNTKTGLLAALLFGIASSSIETGYWIRPVTLGTIFIPILIYTRIEAKEERSPTLLILAIVLGIALILTHTVSSMSAAVLMFLLWLGFLVYQRMYHEKFEFPIALTFGVLFATAMLSWWMYETNHIKTIADMIGRGFKFELWELSPLITNYLFTYTKTEYMLNMFGFNLYLAASCAGLYYMISRGLVNKYRFAFALTVWLLVGIIYFFPLIGRAGVMPGRWYPTLQLITSIPLAMGLILLCGLINKNMGKALLLAVLVLIISFFSITRPIANMDNPIYSKNTMSRFALTESELRAADTIQDMYQGEIKTDQYYSWPFHLGPLDVKLAETDISPNFISGDYAGIEGLVVIRKEIVDRIAFIRGAYKLDHDPRQKLTDLDYNRVYDSGSVSAFLKER